MLSDLITFLIYVVVTVMTAGALIIFWVSVGLTLHKEYMKPPEQRSWVYHSIIKLSAVVCFGWLLGAIVRGLFNG